MNQMINDAIELQSENTLKISLDVTRISNDDQRLKALLATSNDSCFLLNSPPHIKKQIQMAHALDKTPKNVMRQRKENK